MKKVPIFFILMAIAAFSYTEELVNRLIFIESGSGTQSQTEYFLKNFGDEALGLGHPVTNNRAEAGFILRFDVSSNTETDDNQFVIRICLINNIDSSEILHFYFYFNDLNEMYEHNRDLFLKAISVIPPLSEDAVLQANMKWKNKWIYLRASFDYPINFFRLQDDSVDKLYLGIAAYKGNIGSPSDYTVLDHKVIVLPGLTLGVEFQFLNFMSMEANIKAHMGDFITNIFFNLTLQGQLKFPLKFFRPFVISPYLMGAMPVLTSKDFLEFPKFAFGGGIQVNVKGFKEGAFFIDINYLMTIKNAVRKNPFIEGDIFPNPKGIHYKPFVIGLGIGYKFGIGNRR